MELPARAETPRPRNGKTGPRRTLSGPPKRPGRQRSLTEVLFSMELMQNTTSILSAGIDPNWMRQNNSASSSDVEKTYATLKATIERLQRTEGLYVELHAINPDSRDNINELKRKIRDGTGPDGGNKPAWDGVLLGHTLRRDLEMTPLFEELVNFIHETLPGTKILFSGSDEDHADVIRRNFNVGYEKIPLTQTALEAVNRQS